MSIMNLVRQDPLPQWTPLLKKPAKLGFTDWIPSPSGGETCGKFTAKMFVQNAGRSFSASETANIINNEGRLIIYYDTEEREIKRMQKGRGRLPLGAYLDGHGNYVVKVGSFSTCF
jgi:hypothetical protein